MISHAADFNALNLSFFVISTLRIWPISVLFKFSAKMFGRAMNQMQLNHSVLHIFFCCQPNFLLSYSFFGQFRFFFVNMLMNSTLAYFNNTYVKAQRTWQPVAYSLHIKSARRCFFFSFPAKRFACAFH